jgi:hypothetical protein
MSIDAADKYETKRTGLTIDEGLEAAVLGYKVRYDGMPEGAYIHYDFNSWRIQFADIRGRIGEGSSSQWGITDHAKRAAWTIFDPQPQPVNAWGLPVPPMPTGFIAHDDPDADAKLEAAMNEQVEVKPTRDRAQWKDATPRDSWGRPLK